MPFSCIDADSLSPYFFANSTKKRTANRLPTLYVLLLLMYVLPAFTMAFLLDANLDERKHSHRRIHFVLGNTDVRHKTTC